MASPDTLRLVTELIITTAVAAGLEAVFTRARHRKARFSWIHYLLLLSLPILVMIISVSSDLFYLKMAVAATIFGPVSEWLLGRYYHRIVGRRLWHYQFLDIHGHTSWLALPLWATAGVLFGLLARQLG